MNQWNKELEKKILVKSKFTLTIRIIRIIAMFFFIYAAYVIVANIIADRFHVGKEHTYYSTLALEWTIPNVRSDYSYKEGELSVFGTKEISYNLIKKVGNKEIFVGEALVRKKILSALSTIEYSHPGYQTLSEFSFYLPEHPSSGNKLRASEDPAVWETLEKLPEGTVSELAFSTTTFMKTEELLNMLNKYDLRVLWVPLYTGEFKEYNPSSYSSSHNLLMVDQILGLTGGRDHSDNFETNHLIHNIGGTGEDSEQLMLKNMGELVQKSDFFYKQFLGLPHLKEQYNYIVENGFIVYGAVVTGPTKELLKLKDEPNIQGAQLGDVELWNWEN